MPKQSILSFRNRRTTASRHRFLSDCSGTVYLEFVVALPFFLLSLLIIGEVARIYYYESFLRQGVIRTAYTSKVNERIGVSQAAIPDDQIGMSIRVAQGCEARGTGFMAVNQTSGGTPSSYQPDATQLASFRDSILEFSAGVLDRSNLDVLYFAHRDLHDFNGNQYWLTPTGPTRPGQVVQLLAQYRLSPFSYIAGDIDGLMGLSVPDVYFLCFSYVVNNET